MENYEDIQLAENSEIEKYDDLSENEYLKKRELLSNTKIVKQSWSIIEIYQKIKNNKLILDPQYQRNVIWNNEKKIAFIESLYMGIIIPPVYVVEIPSDNVLEGSKYEVVDGKQRLSTIKSFINNDFRLKQKNLEYYADIFNEKNFDNIQNEYNTLTNEMLSSVLDVYVITANSPEFTKYDIFSRLNKGSEKLKVNEIRKAIYRSHITDIIENFVNKNLSDKDLKQSYCQIFTENSIKHYDDYGRFYKSLAFYEKTDISKGIVNDYNSRPREMINNVLQSYQKNSDIIQDETVNIILEKTLELLRIFKNNQFSEYFIDALIPFSIKYWELICKNIDIIKNDETLNSTFVKSPSTTTNINNRVARIAEILNYEQQSN